MNRIRGAVLLVLLTLVAAPMAAEGATIRYGTANGSGGARSPVQANAPCPGETRSLGGGAFASSSAYLSGAFPPAGFSALVYSPQAASVTAVAACVGGRPADELRYIESVVPVGPGSTASTKARCPDGYTVAGGGAIIQGAFPGGSLKVSAPGADLSSWVGEMRNLAASSRQLVVVAKCVTGPFARDLSFEKDSKFLAPGQSGFAFSDCNTGMAVGGGVRATGATTKTSGTGVQSTGLGSASFVDAGTRPVKVTNYLVCHG